MNQYKTDRRQVITRRIKTSCKADAISEAKQALKNNLMRIGQQSKNSDRSIVVYGLTIIVYFDLKWLENGFDGF